MAITACNYNFKVCLMLVVFGKVIQSSQLSFSRCPILHAQWKELIQTNLHHLCKMNGHAPLECISETTDFRFPLQVRNGITSNSGIAIHKILQQILYLLNKDYPNDIWNTTCIENLQNRLYQEIKELETCCGTTENGLMTCDNVTSYPWTLKVKRYFQRMNSFLDDKQHSQCAWEMIFVEIKGCFIFITQFLNELKGSR